MRKDIGSFIAFIVLVNISVCGCDLAELFHGMTKGEVGK